VSATPELFRQAWGKFPTGVSIITTHSENGSPWCTIANAVSSVSLDPLLVQLSLSKTSGTCANIARSGRFGLNFLKAGQEEMATYFAKGTPEQRGTLPTGHRITGNGTVLLDDALVSMDCRVTQQVEAGDHIMFIATVGLIEIREGTPLVFYEGGYASLSAD
jgi:flavin reductase (DIM6/NTAB) family NADH-FMN oxidoreductase RutF